MKRIINKETFNTETATLVAEGSYEDQGTRTETALYQNRNGVYFYVDTITTESRSRNGEVREKVDYEWERVGDAADALECCEKYGLTILRDIEDMPPEAEAGEKMATLYVRMPPVLKARIEAAAKRQMISVNNLALRCFERCVTESGQYVLAEALANTPRPKTGPM